MLLSFLAVGEHRLLNVKIVGHVGYEVISFTAKIWQTVEG